MSTHEDLRSRLRRRPIIAGVKGRGRVAEAVDAGVAVIFFLSGDIFELREAVREVEGSGTLLFTHVDLLEGVGRDRAGIRFLAQEIGVAGILSTRSFLLKAASKEGLAAIQRVFALDSEALRTGMNVIRSNQATAVEILPGLIFPSIAHRLPLPELPPVIAGGLIETEEELDAILSTPGAIAASTSKPQLWKWRP